MSLFVFGIGYTAGHYLGDARSLEIDGPAIGTVRTADKVEALGRKGQAALVFDDGHADPAIETALAQADRLLVSVQPGLSGDSVLSRFTDAIAASRLASIVYLSTIGVYGDHGGAWIDETTPAEPLSERGRARVAVENAWLSLGQRTGKSVQILRLAGIYGPGRNALDDLRQGDARRIDKPGQVFNRIHVGDIGRAIGQAFMFRGGCRVWNVTDDEPAPAPEVVAYAARLMGLEPPPVIPFGEAPLSPMARSFYAANRRVSNRALTQDLGVTLAYPTYRDGLSALWAAGEGRGPV
ncbi:NAD-dependent epimerase/dehydratase family protein [Lichenihabitans psoromatis]|uniref:NAD-dependent epimerase/dehydratase family protein n=1 Tax=Lichenihabitans psoromatis TaxID=2528642 RepID=UPI0010383FB5|nr:NAD-dependent epimerase/dehydratase family protein [Lichenihabitans psoromatis]